MAAPPEMIEVSLNEVEALSQKAARGAGLPWGIAEDAGRTAAWVARHAGTWAATLLDLLETPPPDGETPLLVAPALADGAIASAERVAAPLWVLPPILLGPGRRCPVALRLGAEEIRCNPGEVAGATRPVAWLADAPAAPVALRVGHDRLMPLPNAMPPRWRRSLVPVAEWQRLERLAGATYVAASAESRRRGAGATRLDDD